MKKYVKTAQVLIIGFFGLIILSIAFNSSPDTQKDLLTETKNKQAIVATSSQKTTPPIQTDSIPQSANTVEKNDLLKVTSVVDGDTIKVLINGATKTIRLIGIDTPETVDPRKPVQCFGQEASDKTKEILLNKNVRLESDPTQEDLDKYQRLLRYVFLEDGTFFNKYMIEQGYAYEYTYSVPYEYQAEFKAAQKSAQDNLRGLWAPNVCSEDEDLNIAIPETTSFPATQTSTTNSSTEKYYTSSYGTSKYYYPASCSGWESLSPKYLKSFDSLGALLAAYPSRTLSPQCQ